MQGSDFSPIAYGYDNGASDLQTLDQRNKIVKCSDDTY